MASNVVSRLLVLSSVGIGGFLTGSYLERRKQVPADYVSTDRKTIGEFCPKPALPIFGTVSAASLVSSPAAPVNVSRVGQIMKYGFPGLDNVRSFDDYVLSYDRRTRVAHWVFEHLTPESVKPNDAVDRAKSDFKADDSIHPFFRSLNTDYKGSGFDRGHMAAAGNHRGEQKHCDQTFYLTNMAPQFCALRFE
ncbi:endonuclease G, mitochondrial-like [Anopheles cruzii]|uniref:endonuclease G, mitochondrial-like n=1 Tax=Anopheles cruzii TaxID=68878 RepID=UPI0022EC49E6|nr:endonuclease G, mitochondrial-like [Anopheles cruzii]